MQRRQFIRLAQTGLIGSLATGLAIAERAIAAPPKPETLSIEWLGHMSYLFTGQGQTILSHPFRPAGCTANFPAPKPKTDLILIGSRLLDEGFLQEVPQNTQLLYLPGAYRVGGINLQGIRFEHDRLGGRRFGFNVAWLWQQAGIRILHMGGSATSINTDQRILLGRPDVLIVPVGGGEKAYNAAEAKAIVETLNPKIVIPTYYLTNKAASTCELAKVDEFLALMPNIKVNNITKSKLQLTAASLPETMSISVFRT
ncbi:putative Zn-dependent hydrolase of beta-lactamase fold protein [Synechococcus sp. PCC 7502]|uniref:MBL fold metallo-hydrolase n=1 Tax=Synechococcus sp. PCC 7502 TaxID=1173263 RepID=UPI00029F9184|nr:MBL fold metallo-hydrolase [Synechococcus sp. PCC 7502]AFY72810.1 putative Zn-dependent hydrolase of beta-lactamase fold protein [Synechococcus sp. PCC 7502]